MSHDTAGIRLGAVYKKWSAYFTNQSLSRRNSEYNSSLQQARLTGEARARIPDGPSNISAYLHQRETAEDITMGQATNHNESSMVVELATWEARWKALGDK